GQDFTAIGAMYAPPVTQNMVEGVVGVVFEQGAQVRQDFCVAVVEGTQVGEWHDLAAQFGVVEQQVNQSLQGGHFYPPLLALGAGLRLPVVTVVVAGFRGGAVGQILIVVQPGGHFLGGGGRGGDNRGVNGRQGRSEEHTSELQSRE